MWKTFSPKFFLIISAFSHGSCLQKSILWGSNGDFFFQKFLLHLFSSVLPSGLEDLSPLLHLFIVYMWYEYVCTVYEYVILWAHVLIVYIVITYTVNIQLSLEQHRFEWCRSTYMQNFFNKYVVQYHVTQAWLNLWVWNQGWESTCKIVHGFSATWGWRP